jgi:hypothetical protein
VGLSGVQHCAQVNGLRESTVNLLVEQGEVDPMMYIYQGVYLKSVSLAAFNLGIRGQDRVPRIVLRQNTGATLIADVAVSKRRIASQVW